jgi:GNAT superfamily N-acetyltransferase
MRMIAERIEKVFADHLVKHPLYESGHINVFCISDNTWSINYRISNIPQRKSEMCFSVNIIKGIFYILHINLPQDQRGKGLGKTLYEILAEIARECGCSQIRQTPSGWTHTQETRESYLLRHGWIKSDNEVYKDLKA